MMRRRTITYIATLLLGFCSALSTTALAGDKAALDSRYVAVVVGVNDYTSSLWHSLRYAARDAREMADVLGNSELGGFDEVVLLDGPGDRPPTRGAIEAALARLGASTMPQDVIVFYFSGHATLAHDPAGRLQHYLIPQDADDQNIHESAISVSWLNGELDRYDAEGTVVVLDACYTLRPEVEALLKKKKGLGAASLGSLRHKVVLFAAGEGLNAEEDEVLEHGVFTNFLLEALRREVPGVDLDRSGGVSAHEAHLHAEAATVDHTQSRQIPMIELTSFGSPNVVLSGSRGGRATEAVVLTYQPRRFKGCELQLTPTSGDGEALSMPAGRGAGLPPGSYRGVLRTEKGHRVAAGRVFLHAGRNPVEDLFSPPTRNKLILGVQVGPSGVASLSPATGPILPRFMMGVRVGVDAVTPSPFGFAVGLGFHGGHTPETGALRWPPGKALTGDGAVLVHVGQQRTAFLFGPSFQLRWSFGGFQGSADPPVLGPGFRLGGLWRIAKRSSLRCQFDVHVIRYGEDPGDPRSHQLVWTLGIGVGRLFEIGRGS